MKQVFYLNHDEARKRALEAIKHAPSGYKVTVGESSRSLDQNAFLWPLLQSFSNQVLWPINGVMSKLTKEDWKDILTAAFREQSPRLVPGLNGGMVMLGIRTSKLGKKEFSDFLDFIHSVAVDRGVNLGG